MPKITTILPTFQRPKLLARAIESVLNQKFQDFILCIYDNHSQDETPLVAAEYQKMDNRIQFYRRTNNCGPFENFSQALDCVSTPYFSFLSDDDYLLPWFYETHLNALNRYPDAGLSASRTLMINTKGKLPLLQFMYRCFSGYYTAGAGALALAASAWFPIWTGILFKKEILIKTGGLDRKAGYAFDMDFTLRYASCSPCIFIPKPTAVLMAWEEAGSLSTVIQESNYDTMIANVHALFVGSSVEKNQLIEKLKLIKNKEFKHQWISALLSNDMKKARHAKEVFLRIGGRESQWKLFLLSLTEKNPFMRKLLLFYLQLKNNARLIIAYIRRRRDREMRLFLCEDKNGKYTTAYRISR